MPSILNTSLTGMLAFQRGLAVTSHNIANANTPGYSRQVVEYTSRPGTGVGNSYIGAGTQVAAVRRMYDDVLATQLQDVTTSQARFELLDDLASRVDRLLSDADTGLGSGLQGFFGAVQDVANDPGSIPARQALLGEAANIAGKFQTLDAQFAQISSEVTARISESVGDINRIANAIGEINGKVSTAGGIDRAPPDLLDERDRLVLELSSKVSVSTTLQDDGSMSVFVGSGQTLVIGGDAKEFELQQSEFDPTAINVVYGGAAGGAPIDRALTGGELGGLIEFRDDVLDPARRSVGLTATALAGEFNRQHTSGMDLRGQLGADFFSIAEPGVLHSAGNSGSATVTATVTDISSVTGDDYILRFDGANFELSSHSTGLPVPMTGSGTPGDPYRADGLEITVSGAAVAGDEVLVRSAYDAAASLRSSLSDPQAIAMAAPVRTSSSIANLGDANISPATSVDATDPGLLSTVEIEFLSATSYSINGAGSYVYSDGDVIEVNGNQFAISGTPAPGDQFTLAANFGASGDNSNGLQLAEVQSVGILSSGSVSIGENHSQLIADIGSKTHQIQSNKDAQDALLRNAEDAVLEKSAVNLDEEAARLLQYQQAYQAVAQVVAVANSLFDSLLYATRR